ncbi:MAG: branched-chain amino acid ABC transporter permease [Candidatus Dormibacteria bacterium]
MSGLVQQLVLGLLLGGVYTGIALGFGLVWGVLNIVNLTHGALVLCGAYITWWLFSTFGIDPFVGLIPAAVVLFGIGYALQRLVINRVIRAPLLFTFLLTFGINLVIVNLLLLIFKADFRSVTPRYAGSGLEAGGVTVPFIRLAALAVSLLLALALATVLNRTRVGAAIQAVAADREAAQLVGVDLAHTYALTFAIGAACAGVAGGLISTIQSIAPGSSGQYTLTAFVVVILGGLGRVSATVVGGLLFGLVEILAQSNSHIGAGYSNAIAFGLMVIVVSIRPRGLMGRLSGTAPGV